MQLYGDGEPVKPSKYADDQIAQQHIKYISTKHMRTQQHGCKPHSTSWNRTPHE